MKKWNEQGINVQKCGIAIVKANMAGKELSHEFCTKMQTSFSSEELDIIEKYTTMKTLYPNIIGADYMTAQDMEKKINEKEI